MSELFNSELLSVLGTGAITAALLLVAGALVSGYPLGGPERATRVVLGLGTAQRLVNGIGWIFGDDDYQCAGRR